MRDDLYPVDDEQLVLGDLLNHVLDKGVVITGDVTISIADIDLVRVGLSVLLSSVETAERTSASRRTHHNADVPLLPDEGRR
jgi:gas vesicle structural protein